MEVPAGARPSPNLWQHPATYALLEAAEDPDGQVLAALRRAAPWAGGTVVDVGCGTGVHLASYASGPGAAARVVGVEPHPGLVERARARVAAGPDLPGRVVVRQGTAQDLPLGDRSAGAVVARWAYFFGPGCEPGIREAMRVLRPGGVLAVVDVDPAAPEGYAAWFRAAWPQRAATADPFFVRLGFRREALAVRWAFRRRADLEAVLRIEFPPRVAEAAVRATAGLEVPVPTVLRTLRAGLPQRDRCGAYDAPDRSR